MKVLISLFLTAAMATSALAGTGTTFEATSDWWTHKVSGKLTTSGNEPLKHKTINIQSYAYQASHPTDYTYKADNVHSSFDGLIRIVTPANIPNYVAGETVIVFFHWTSSTWEEENNPGQYHTISETSVTYHPFSGGTWADATVNFSKNY